MILQIETADGDNVPLNVIDELASNIWLVRFSKSVRTQPNVYQNDWYTTAINRIVECGSFDKMIDIMLAQATKSPFSQQMLSPYIALFLLLQMRGYRLLVSSN